MKIYFNRKPASGPWGGGSKILSAVIEEALARGHEVFFGRSIRDTEEHFDLIFCSDPRPQPECNLRDIIVRKKKHKTKIVQRVGDLGTHGKPDMLPLILECNCYADVVVFPSQWAQDRLQSVYKEKPKNFVVIKNEPLPDFLTKESKEILLDSKLSLFTHHWSMNPAKGFETYQKLDSLCDEVGRGMLDFTYMGRLPFDFSPKNHVPPGDVSSVKNEMSKHNVYVTSSVLEAGANHALEAIAANMPILCHKDGGSIVEYAAERAVVFDDFSHLRDILTSQKHSIVEINNRISKDPYLKSSIDTARQYIDLMEKL